jgi:hypothetical protein
VPRLLLLPSEEELPPGPRRRFVEELYLYFLDAGRPDLARLVSLIDQLVDDPLTPVSVRLTRETVRKILKGKTLSTWKRVECLFLALCHMTGRNPEDDRWANEPIPFQSHTDYLRELWTAAADVVPISPGTLALPSVQKKSQATPSGWGSGGG